MGGAFGARIAAVRLYLPLCAMSAYDKTVPEARPAIRKSEQRQLVLLREVRKEGKAGRIARSLDSLPASMLAAGCAVVVNPVTLKRVMAQDQRRLYCLAHDEHFDRDGVRYVAAPYRPKCLIDSVSSLFKRNPRPEDICHRRRQLLALCHGVLSAARQDMYPAEKLWTSALYLTVYPCRIFGLPWRRTRSPGEALDKGTNALSVMMSNFAYREGYGTLHEEMRPWYMDTDSPNGIVAALKRIEGELYRLKAACAN